MAPFGDFGFLGDKPKKKKGSGFGSFGFLGEDDEEDLSPISSLGGLEADAVDTNLSAGERLSEMVASVLPKVQSAAQVVDYFGNRSEMPSETIQRMSGEDVGLTAKALDYINPVNAPVVANKGINWLLDKATGGRERQLSDVITGSPGKTSEELAREANVAAFREQWGRDPGLTEEPLVAPMKGDILTAKWHPEGPIGESLKTLSTLGVNMATSPSMWLGAGPAAKLSSIPKAKTAAEALVAAGKVALTSPWGGAVFAPQLAGGIRSSVEQVIEGAKEGSAGEVASGLITGVPMALLAGMMGKGITKNIESPRARAAREKAAAIASAKRTVESSGPLEIKVSGPDRGRIQEFLSGEYDKTDDLALSDSDNNSKAAALWNERKKDFSDIHSALADEWEADRQSAPRAASDAISALIVQNQENTDVKTVTKSLLGNSWGERLVEALTPVAERVADYRRERKLSERARNGDVLAGELSAVVGQKDAIPLRNGRISADAMIEMRAKTLIDMDPSMPVRDAMRQATDSVLDIISEHYPDQVDPGSPTLREDLIKSVQDTNPLGLDVAAMAKDQPYRRIGELRREAWQIKRRQLAPELDETAHQVLDRLDMLRSKIDDSYYGQKLSSPDPDNPDVFAASLAKDRLESEALASALRANSMDEFYARIQEPFKSYLESRSDPPPADKNGNPLRGKAKSAALAKRAATLLQEYTGKLYKALDGEVEISGPVREYLGSRLQGPDLPVQRFGVTPWHAEESAPRVWVPADQMPVSADPDVTAAAKAASDKRTITDPEVSPFTEKTVPLLSRLYDKAVEIGRGYTRLTQPVLSHTFGMLRKISPIVEKAGRDFQALRLGHADNIEKILRTATTKVDRANPGRTPVTGPGIGHILTLATDAKWLSDFTAVMMGRFAEHRWNVEGLKSSEGEKVLGEKADVLAQYRNAKADVEAKNSPEYVASLHRAVKDLVDFSNKAFLDQLESVGMLSPEMKERIQRDTVNGKSAEGDEDVVWAPLDYIEKALADANPELADELGKAVGDTMPDPFGAVVHAMGDGKSDLVSAPGSKSGLFPRKEPLNKSQKLLDPVTAVVHRLQRIQRIVDNQRILNLIPDLYMSTLDGSGQLPHGFVTPNIEEPTTISWNGKEITLQPDKEEIKRLKAAGGGNVTVYYGGKKINFLVENDVAKDLNRVSPYGAKAVSDSVGEAIAFARKAADRFPKTAAFLGNTLRLRKASITWSPQFAVKQALRDPVDASIRSQHWVDVPWWNLMSGAITNFGARLGLDTDMFNINLRRTIDQFGMGQSSVMGDTSPVGAKQALKMAQHVEGSKNKMKPLWENVAVSDRGSVAKFMAIGKDASRVLATIGEDENLRTYYGTRLAKDMLKEVTPDMRAAAEQDPVYKSFVTDPQGKFSKERDRVWWLTERQGELAEEMRNSNLDFADRGAGAAALNGMEMFLSPQYIAYARQKYALKADPAKYLTKLMVYTGIPALVEGYYAAQDPADDERNLIGQLNWQSMPRTTDLYNNISKKTGELGEVFAYTMTLPGTDKGFYFPRPQGVLGFTSYAIRTAAKAVFRDLLQKDPEAYRTLGAKLAGSLVESAPGASLIAGYNEDTGKTGLSVGQAASSAVPAVADPAVDLWRNRASYYDKEIMPDPELAPSMAEVKYDPWFIDMARKLKVSPFGIDYALSEYAGGVKGAVRYPYAKEASNELNVSKSFAAWSPPREPVGSKSASVNRVYALDKLVAKDWAELKAMVDNEKDPARPSQRTLDYASKHPWANNRELKDAIKSWKDDANELRKAIRQVRESGQEQDVIKDAVYRMNLVMSVRAQQLLNLIKAHPRYSFLLDDKEAPQDVSEAPSE